MQRVQPEIKHISSCDELKKKVNLYKINGIYFGNTNVALYQRFEEYSKIKSGYLFFSADGACGKSFGGSGDN